MTFTYQAMLPLAKDTTTYRLLTKDHVSVQSFDGQDIVKIEPAALTLLAQQAFSDVSHLLRPTHLSLLKKILYDPESSENDRYVALDMLKNALLEKKAIALIVENGQVTEVEPELDQGEDEAEAPE